MKVAVTVCVPAVNEDVLPEIAEPPLTVTGEPKLTPSITNWILPVAVLGLMVDVKLTALPYVDGELDEETVVVVATEPFTVKEVCALALFQLPGELLYCPLTVPLTPVLGVKVRLQLEFTVVPIRTRVHVSDGEKPPAIPVVRRLNFTVP